jgi:hypothetical protein
MIARVCLGITVLMCLCTAIQAQEKSVGYMLRTEGYAFEADALGRIVRLKMSPGWAKILERPGGETERTALAVLIGAFVEAGVPSERPLRSLHTGLLLATLEEWEGKSSLQVELNFEPDTASRAEMVKSFEQLAASIENTTQSPKAMRLAVAFESEAKTVQRSAFRERGSQIFLVLPAQRGWSQAVVEQILRSPAE